MWVANSSMRERHKKTEKSRRESRQLLVLIEEMFYTGGGETTRHSTWRRETEQRTVIRMKGSEGNGKEETNLLTMGVTEKQGKEKHREQEAGKSSGERTVQGRDGRNEGSHVKGRQ